MRHLATILLCLFAAGASAQTWMLPDDAAPDSGNYVVGVRTAASSNSNAVTSNFSLKLVRGGYIDADLKDEVQTRLTDNNRLGASLDVEVFGGGRIDSLFGKPRANLSWFVRAGDHQFVNGQFATDAFNVAFYGNQAYRDASFDNTSINIARYQRTMAGWINQTPSGNRYGIGLGYLNGEQLLMVDIDKGSLVTKTDAPELEAALQANAWFSDTANTGFAAGNGFGAALDAFYEIDLSADSSNSILKLRVDVLDLGLIQWGTRTLEYGVDSALSYTGLHITSFDQLQDSILSARVDSLGDNITYQSTRKGVVNTMLPARLRVQFSREGTTTITSGGVEYRPLAHYLPFGWVRETWKINHRFRVSGSVGYGGYGTLATGLDAGIYFKNIQLALGTGNIEGLLLPSQTGGLSGFASLRVQF